MGAAGALVERFSETEKLDLVSVLRRFYASHADAFEQVVVYTTRPLNPAPGTLAFELNIKNAVTGIGLEPVDAAAAWGSAGTLESVVYRDAVDPYLGSDGFEFLAHEVGHRWLARLRFREGSGALSSALLGRGAVHWSFFLDTQASVLEGNSIRDLGGGRFETVDFARGYGPLDQYVMGLRAPQEVPPLFYVDSPDDFRPSRPYKAGSTPEAGVTFTGAPAGRSHRAGDRGHGPPPPSRGRRSDTASAGLCPCLRCGCAGDGRADGRRRPHSEPVRAVLPEGDRRTWPGVDEPALRVSGLTRKRVGSNTLATAALGRWPLCT